MKYKITSEQVKLMMDDILKRKNIEVDIVYRIHALHTNDITATVYLYKDDQVFGYRFGYDFVFKYDKRFDTLTPESHFPKIERLDFLKMIPERVILKYFTDKTEEYLRGYLDRGNVPEFKRVVSEELDTTKSNYEKQVAVLKRLLKSKSYDGLCGYSFTADSDNDEVSRVNLKISSKWDRLSNDQLRALSQAEDDIRDICKKFLGMENLNIRYYSEDCDSSLNEETTPKDDAFQRVLKKVIPDDSTYKYSYSLPYSDEGEVKVIMKYSPLSSSRLMKMVREDGTFYNGIQLNLQIDELIWKSNFDKEWETIKRPQDLSTRFWSEFEDEMSDRFRKAVGMGYVDVYYRNPDSKQI